MSQIQTENLSILEKKETPFLILTFSHTFDKLKLFLEVEIKENIDLDNFTISSEELCSHIPKGIKPEFINQDIVADIAFLLNRKASVPMRRIAKGVEAIPGRNGKLVLLVKSYEKHNPNTEYIDPWYLKKFDNILKDTVVARIYPAKPAIDGFDIFGITITNEEVKEAVVEIDETLRKVESTTTQPFTSLVANISGYLQQEKDTLSVIHNLEIGSDLDGETGDLDFPGNININGSIMKDFSLKADGSITIAGDLINGRLISGTGDITVTGYAVGTANVLITNAENAYSSQLSRTLSTMEPSQIRCLKNFKANSLDNISLEAIGTVDVEREIKSSTVRTKTIVRIPRGQIIGGSIYVACGLEANIIGSQSTVHTAIHLCSDIESSAEYSELNDKIKSHNSAENLLKLYLGPYAENPKHIKYLKDAHKEKMQGLLLKLANVQESKAALLERKQKLISNAHSNMVYRINILQCAHVGLEIIAGDEVFRLNEDLIGPKTIEYLVEEKKFLITELKQLECSFLS